MTRALAWLATTAFGVGAALGAAPRIELPADVLALDRAVDWSTARLIAVQDGGRYKTLDSFARESLTAMCGREHLPGASPLASLLEWTFNRQAYVDSPVILLKDRGLQIHLTAHMPDAQRSRIRETGFLTLREMHDPVVLRRIRELEPRFEMNRAMQRVRYAEAVAKFPERLMRIVPRPGGDATHTWLNVRELTASLPPEVLQQAGHTPDSAAREYGPPVPGVEAETALAVVGPWAALQSAWVRRDAAGVQQALSRLERTLPQLADPGVYPTASQREAEARYYAMGKLTKGYWVYLIAGLVGVLALVTHWRTPWIVALVFLAGGMALHTYGVSLRWFILGRIPVANMFEAVTSSALVAVALGFAAELVVRNRVFLVGAATTGFLALVLGDRVIPGGGTLTNIMGILDDVMLRIHTVCIIASYALVFLAAVIAVVYLFGHYFHHHAARSTEVGLAAAAIGAVLYASGRLAFREHGIAGGADGVVKLAGIEPAFWVATILALLLLGALWARRASGLTLAGTGLVACACLTLAIGSHGYVRGMAAILGIGGVVWAALNAIGIWWRAQPVAAPRGFAVALAGMSAGGGGPPPELHHGGGLPPGPPEPPDGKPLAWLANLDWCHQIVLHLVFVLLFAGVILGAVWADYSWGRPWGWDPKEVFAMNTWLVYVILIHVRFLVADRGLWTAWLSVLGCLMMAFNWVFVNFYIVGLHSYA